MKYQQPLFATASTHTLVTSLETPSNVDYFQKRVFLFGMNADQGSSDAGFQGNLFKLTYSKNNTAYDYLIPDAIYSSFMPESYTWNQTVASYSYSSAEYQMSLSCESNFDFGLSFGGISMNWFEVSVATSVDYQYASDIFASYEAVLVTSRAKTKTWSASLSNYMAPDQMNLIQLDSEFEYLVSKLPIEYNFDKYLSFVEGGTHYVKKLTMGAKYSCRTFFENATLATMKSEGIDIDVTASESTWFEATSKAAHISKSTSLEVYDDNALGIKVCSGHGPLPPSIDPNVWNEVAKTDSYPLEMELGPLTDILTASYFPNDPNILIKATNFLRACSEYCERTQKCYTPSPPTPKPKWGDEFTVTNGNTAKLMKASEATCFLTQVYRSTFEACYLFVSNLEIGDPNYYWYIQASSTSNILCSARCSTEITWPLMNQLPNENVSSSFRSYRLGHPYTYKGTYSLTLEPQASSFCFLNFLQNQVGCGDHGLVYPDSNTSNWVLGYHTYNPWNSGHQDLNSMDRVYGAVCLNITSTPVLLLEAELNADQGIVPLMLVDDGVCIFEKIQATGLCCSSGQGGGVRLKQEEVAGLVGIWWAFEGYSARSDDIRCVGTAHIKCYSY